MKRNEAHHIHELLHEINYKVNYIMATLQDVLVETRNESDLDDSIIVILNGVVQQLKDAQASNDPAAVQAVIDQIETNKKKISDAITANTPASPVTSGTATPQ